MLVVSSVSLQSSPLPKPKSIPFNRTQPSLIFTIDLRLLLFQNLNPSQSTYGRLLHRRLRFNPTTTATTTEVADDATILPATTTRGLYQQQNQPISNQIQTSSEEHNTIWVGDLQHWMDYTYLQSFFSRSERLCGLLAMRLQVLAWLTLHIYEVLMIFGTFSSATVPVNSSHGSGPNLNGLFGRQSGTTAGYSYSAANKNMVVIWGENTLYDYLLNHPKKACLGCKWR